MDNLTHAVLGATLGGACFGRTLGRRASLWGAAASVVPDLDLLTVAVVGPLGEFRYHRGLTHALWFGPVVGSLLGYAVWRWYAARKRRREQAGQRGARVKTSVARPDPGALAMMGTWIGLFVLVIFTHPLLDVFTTYGTRLLAPFSRHRFALDAVAIIDPAYTFFWLAALGAIGLTGFRPRITRVAGLAAFVLSTLYLFYGLFLNQWAETVARRQLEAEGVRGAEVQAYPTILQTFLRRVVARAPGQVRVGLISMWRPGRIEWQSFTPAQHPFIEDLRRTPEGRMFEWFTTGQNAAHIRTSAEGYVVQLEDLRYGYSTEPDEGLWGIRAVYDAQGRRMGPVERFNRRPADLSQLLRGLWRATWGTPPTAGQAAVAGRGRP